MSADEQKEKRYARQSLDVARDGPSLDITRDRILSLPKDSRDGELSRTTVELATESRSSGRSRRVLAAILIAAF